MSAPKLVHLYPTADHYIPGVPAVECDVTADVAAELLAYHPPAFTTKPPPETPAAEPTGPANAGPSDSTPEV